jgi:hypothetical protein
MQSCLLSLPSRRPATAAGIAALFAIALALQALDLTSSLALWRNDPSGMYASEHNPLILALAAFVGLPMALVIAKVVVCLALLAWARVWWRSEPQRDLAVALALGVVVTAYLRVIGTNLTLGL